MAAPTADDLGAFTGKTLNNDEYDQVTAVIQLITAMASSYTRGRGFTDGEPGSDIRAVILLASARLLTDTSQITADKQMGPFSVSYRNGFDGWTVNELYVLNRYRERAR